MASLDDLRQAKKVLTSRLLRTGLRRGLAAMRFARSVRDAVANAGTNVHAVGIGRKLVEGKPTRDFCVRLYVAQKLARSLLSLRDAIPALVDGIVTDVIESPPAVAQAKRKARRPVRAAAADAAAAGPRDRHRPVVAGISAAHHDVTAGTIGFFCRSVRAGDDPDRIGVVSNNHVFADLNQGTPGDALDQPGPLDRATDDDHFADLLRFVPVELGIGGTNRVDAALGLIRNGIEVVNEIPQIGAVGGVGAAHDGMLVRKHGRTTELREGKITDADYDALIGMDHLNPDVVALFEGQLRIESTTGGQFCRFGDSGAAVVERTRPNVVGLLCGCPEDGSYGVASPIQEVLSALEVKLL